MRRVIVHAPGGAYSVVIGRGALDRLGFIVSGRGAVSRPSSLFVVTDERVERHHFDALSRVLSSTGFPIACTVLPSGEKAKSVRCLERIWREAVQHGADRRTLFISFGGGVVGDITGFAAASTLRGVDFVHVPTTLLAMVDASVGGKTGINLPEGKNLVGAFHQPRAVVMDLDLLRTLPDRELRAGWAEVIKTAAIRDAALFRKIVRERDALLVADSKLLGDVVARCVRIKARVVEEDERESGLRMILNFGHTLAHGIEAAQAYGDLLHGEAVAIGMVFALRLGERLGVSPAGIAIEVEDAIRRFGLPVRPDRARSAKILAAMHRDKKRGPRGLRWVLLERLGKARIVEDVPERVIEDELGQFLGGR